MSPLFKTNKSERLLELFSHLTLQLTELGEWQETPPDVERLTSNQPFAVDTLTPAEWLQWIFLPKMTQLIQSKQPLPNGFAVSPYFEQAWQTQPHYRELLLTLSNIDKECT